MSNFKPEQLQTLSRVASNMVATMQERFTPIEALGVLSMALQMAICSSMPTRQEGHEAIDRMVGDLHIAVNANLPADHKTDDIRVNGAGHG